MPRKREKKTFLKIKEKLVFVTPKRFFGRKVVGIIFLIGGTLLLALSLIYFFLIPRLFPDRPKIEQVLENKNTFLPRRVLIPSVNLNFLVYEGIVAESDFSEFTKVKKGDEILILGKETYKIYRLTNIETKIGSASSSLILNERSMKLVLLREVKPSKNLIIEGALSDSNY